jgi:chemotaxis response regulator CheB
MSLVAEASNGREAIQQFRAHHPDVTLMDLRMTEMNGLDATIAIRGEFAEARIIVSCINSRLGSLRPSHRWSLGAVDLNELSLGWAAGKGKKSRTLGNVRTRSLGPYLR